MFHQFKELYLWYQKKIISAKIKLTPIGEVEKEQIEFTSPFFLSSTAAEKKRYNISAKYFLLPLHIKSLGRDRCFREKKKKRKHLLYSKTMKNVDGSMRIGFVHEDVWKKKWQLFSFYMLNNREHRRKWIIYPHQKIYWKKEKFLAVHEML